jgi:dipeptidase E
MTELLLTSTMEFFDCKLDDVFGEKLASMNVLCVPTAAYGENSCEWLEGEIAPFRNRVKELRMVDIAGKSYEEILPVTKDIDIIYVTGGNTYYLLEHVRCSGFDKIVTDFLTKGGIYAGSSAGSILACPGIDFIEKMDDPAKASLDDFSGLGLVDFLIVPHVDSKEHGDAAREIISNFQNGEEIIVGLRDDQALYIQDSYMKVF